MGFPGQRADGGGQRVRPIPRPETPSTLDATEESLMPAS